MSIHKVLHRSGEGVRLVSTGKISVKWSPVSVAIPQASPLARKSLGTGV
ncbi:hypothetical protein [Dyadobacter bucti]